MRRSMPSTGAGNKLNRFAVPRESWHISGRSLRICNPGNIPERTMKRMSFSANIHTCPECNSPWQSSTDTVAHEGRHATQKTYPFRNYWTAPGGLSEALVPLLSKQDAELMIDKYFLHVDPLYPIIPQAVFRARVESFWASSHESRFVILHTVVI